MMLRLYTGSFERACHLRVIAVIGLSMLLITTQGCGGQDDLGQLQVEGLRLTKLPSGAKIISGSVRNSSTKNVSGVLVQISLFDGENNLLSSMTVGVQDLGAGEKRRFREPIDSDLDVHRARVKKVVSL